MRYEQNINWGCKTKCFERQPIPRWRGQGEDLVEN